ncbi:double zinc ribbon and ankyrin repeat-containing protein 1 [Dunckerocampus dactyliophorus]|uniref:double zinc ribbon and ankyrin repeat-containing protein 1 n=1 Tax=Dunckerocampus dactyliophorus TaxID=161453 RepID=UPI002406A72C|nr:double zinc ribbon and ankyrin repeat-containing protein 1 [Dunckerocampus dactyliophorus]
MTAGAVAAPRIIPIMHRDRLRVKHHIDTSTRVCIQSDTREAHVFFTLDGSKPLADQGGSGSVSQRYREPLQLPAGRVCVRAMAATSDGRESAIVTKVFLVQLDEEEEPSQQADVIAASHSPQGSKTARSASPRAAPRFLKNRASLPNTTQSASPHTQSESAGLLKQLSSTQAARVQRETDFLRCAHCLTFRPSDLFASFCAQCGAALPRLPQHRLPPAEGGQLVCCVLCNTQVPVNTHACLICHASIKQQLLPQSSLQLQDHVVCVCCGRGNPPDMSNCLACETRLHTTALETNGAPPVPSPHHRKVTCSKCQRLNSYDARYCDWCGCKCTHALSSVLCRRCGASGPPHAIYCSACGAFLDAPRTCCHDVIPPAGGADTNQAAQTTPSSWKSGPPTMERHTQTVGLHYPSATELHRKQQQNVSRKQTINQPPHTAISPGRGYWRKQLDHVCAHLRSFAQNNAPFRTLLGEPRLGRMVSAVLEEDAHEVSVTISFMVSSQEGSQEIRQEVRRIGSEGETLSSVTERTHPGRRGSGRKTNMMVRDSQLLQEVGPARGHVDVIQQLLDQAADPRCCGSDGRHALALATANGHHEVLPVLVQAGADVDQRSGPLKNTALHEAAALGSEGLRCAEVLLSCKAATGLRNKNGHTACDVATRTGCEPMISLLAGTGPDE